APEPQEDRRRHEDAVPADDYGADLEGDGAWRGHDEGEHSGQDSTRSSRISWSLGCRWLGHREEGVQPHDVGDMPLTLVQRDVEAIGPLRAADGCSHLLG